MKRFIIILLSFSAMAMLSGQEQFELKQVAVKQASSEFTKEIAVQPLINKLEVEDFDSLNMNFAGSWSLGQSYTIASSMTGDTVFIGSGAGVIIMDATDPYNPVELSEVYARALVDGIQYNAAEGRLYLSAYFSGFEVWDVSDILNPHRLGRAETSGLPRAGVYVPGENPGGSNTAFLVTVADGIDVFNVDVSGTPTFINNQTFTSQLTWNCFGDANTLFLSSGTAGTFAIDVSDPMNLGSAFTVPGASTSIAAKDQMLYVLNSSLGMKVYDYSSLPATQAGMLNITGFPYRISIGTSHAYIANSTTNPGGGVNAIDISDPGNLQQVGNYEGYQTYITGNENKVFATGGTEGCVMLDMTDPANPALASSYPLPVAVNDIAVEGNYAYTGNHGFRVFDVSDKSHPVQIGYEETDGALVKLYGSHAVYCPKSMGSSNRINIMDISDPTDPQNVGYYLAPVMTYDLDLKGNYAYVACWWDGIRVVDFSDPENPALTAHVMGWVNGGIAGEEWFYAQALDVSGDYLYAVDYGPFPDDSTKGLYIFDISDPANPALVHRMPEYQGSANDIEVSNGTAYIADADGGLTVIDVMDPMNPEQVAYLPLGDVAWAVDVFGDYAFVANYILEGVQAINISNPETPFVEGYYKPTGCFALNVTYNAGYVYVSDGPAGMGIYNFDLLSGTTPDKINSASLEIYPNPAKERIIVSWDLLRSGTADLSLFNIAGQKVMSVTCGQSGSDKLELNVGDLPRGIYLIELKSGKESRTEKIILR